MSISKIQQILTKKKVLASELAKRLQNAPKKAISSAPNSKSLEKAMESMASLNKNGIHIKKISPFTQNVTRKLAIESIIEGATAEEALRGAKEIMAATKMQNYAKSASESAAIFVSHGKTATEKTLDKMDAAAELSKKLAERKAKLMKKYGDKLPERMKALAEKQKSIQEGKRIADEIIKLSKALENTKPNIIDKLIKFAKN